jgi:hypothetical protein
MAHKERQSVVGVEEIALVQGKEQLLQMDE